MDAEKNQIALTPQEIEQATAQLIQQVEDRAIDSGIRAEEGQAALGPSLATGSNLQGGYNYQRFVQPTVDPLVANLTTDARRSVFRQALNDAAYQAQTNYENEQSAYNQRYRDYQAEQARRSRERQRRADASAASISQAQIAALRNSGSGGVGVSYSGKDQPYYTQNGSSFQFYAANGTPITMAQYAKQMNIPITQALQTAGSQGDVTSQRIYDQLKYLAPGSAQFNNALSMYARTVPHVLGGV